MIAPTPPRSRVWRVARIVLICAAATIALPLTMMFLVFAPLQDRR